MYWLKQFAMVDISIEYRDDAGGRYVDIQITAQQQKGKASIVKSKASELRQSSGFERNQRNSDIFVNLVNLPRL